MVGYTLAVKPGYGFGSFLPGKVIIQITVDNGVVFQFCKTFLQITDGVHYEKIGLAIYTNMEISFSVELLIREEIHKALEHTDVALDYLLVVSDDGYVFPFYTSLIIRITHLVTARYVLKHYGEIMPLA